MPDEASNNVKPSDAGQTTMPDNKAPVDRKEGMAPGEAGNTANDSVIEKPNEILPGDGSLSDTAPTRSV